MGTREQDSVRYIRLDEVKFGVAITYDKRGKLKDA